MGVLQAGFETETFEILFPVKPVKFLGQNCVKIVGGLMLLKMDALIVVDFEI